MRTIVLAVSIAAIISTIMVTSQSSISASGTADTLVWSNGPDVPLPRGGYFAAWYKGGLVLAGGTYWKDGKKLWTDNVSFFNPKTGNWEDWSPLPRPVAYGVMAQADGELYQIGGIDEATLRNDIYKLSGNQWKRVGEAPAGVVYGVAAAIGRKIYVTGGGTSNNDLTTATNQAWSYDVRSGKWERLPSVPGPPLLLQAVVPVGSELFVFGGMTQPKGEAIRNLADSYKFDTRTKTWHSIKAMPQAARAHWGASAGKFIYLFGGYGEKGLDTVYRYDPAADDYELISHLPQPLMDTKFFYDKGKFYGATGEDKAASRYKGLLIAELSQQQSRNRK